MVRQLSGRQSVRTLLCGCPLASLQEHHWHPVVGQGPSASVDGLHGPLLQLLGILGVHETQGSEADLAVVSAVAVEVQDVGVPSLRSGRAQGGDQGREGGWFQHLQVHQRVQVRHGFHRRQGAGLGVEEADPLVVGLGVSAPPI